MVWTKAMYDFCHTLTFQFVDSNKNHDQSGQKLLKHQYFHDCVHVYPEREKREWDKLSTSPVGGNRSHNFLQSVNSWSFHMRSGFESGWEVLMKLSDLVGKRQVV